MNNGYTIYPYVIYPSGTAAATLRAAREIARKESTTAQGCPARIKSSRTNKVVTTYEDGRETGI